MLVGVVGSFLVERVVEALNLRALDGELPADWRGWYDAERYRTAQTYTRARTGFGAVVATAELGLLLAVWFGGGFGWLDRWAHRLGGGPIGEGLVFLGALTAGQLLAGLPARWWSTFVLEARFGFNRTTAGTFWVDTAKGIGLGVVLGGPLLAGVLWLFARMGSSAWWWCWGVAAAWTIGLQYVAPTWILPLFSRFTSLAPGPVRDALLAYAARVEFPVHDVSVVDGSRRSTKANAFFTGFGRNKRIALFDRWATTSAATCWSGSHSGSSTWASSSTCWAGYSRCPRSPRRSAWKRPRCMPRWWRSSCWRDRSSCPSGCSSTGFPVATSIRPTASPL
jgi:STE24 endopeptidase